MQLFSADATMFSNFFFFCHQKVEKTTLKSCSEKLKSTFFPLLPAQPKWPKQKNSCSKMWPIDQLYIELGLYQMRLLFPKRKCKLSGWKENLSNLIKTSYSYLYSYLKYSHFTLYLGEK